ncbi:FemAB-related protein, PEP-CTERM system-associated [Nitrosococcus halophilus Nc 4]|uniref:FemAB-related protein, PEP-CTERM system-associated n=1 Tax=Nitrosococcus halophilus (strain Nc4) TaxID=472759 RepID=D5C042_NITHN|nr:FemAB family XrtA/PEP-CTERM system-associated protein [Nitrosococcus halophilus]ADE16289.1 FemAB-related protein, PEP-CTERM system-associated [Nitrosococcus halophilus Nc 4]
MRNEAWLTSEASSLRVCSLTKEEERGWDEFVEAHPEATFFHLSGWREVLERAYGHATYYSYAEQDGKVVGVLPLGRIRSRMFGDALISTPFCVYGGAVGSREACEALESAACRLAWDLGVDYLELRNLQPRHFDWPRSELYVTFRKSIDPDPERNFAAIPRKQRAMVRKGIKAGLAGIIEADIERFFLIYSESVRNLGTPVFPKHYFKTLKAVFGDRCEILTILYQGCPVSSVMSFYFRDEVLPYYGGGSATARDFKANDFMYWELMRRACERGLHVFDYGRSKLNTGSYRFKTHWGFEPQPLHYEYKLIKANKVPEKNPLNPRYRLFVEGWRRLPVPLTRWIGPWIARDLG